MLAYALACNTGTFAASGPDSASDGAITTSIANCPDGRDVVLITVDGGGHEWPSFATRALWQFFAAH
jgi:polyhydroxybutyrate depolymerase